MQRLLVSLILLLSLGSQVYADIVYTVPNIPLGSDGYGIEGTITTDGSLGSFANVSAITDWSFTLSTPSAADGIATHVLNLANSDLTFDFTNGTELFLTGTTIELTPTTTFATQDFVEFASKSDAAGDRLQLFSGSFLAGFPSQYQIIDGSENPSRGFGGGNVANANFVVGTAVPEPTSSFLFIMGTLVLFTSRRRR